MPRPDVFIDQQGESAVRQAGAAGLDVTQLFQSTREATSIVSGVFTVDTRANRASAVGEADGDRWKESDTGWLYYYDSGWHYESGLYSATDAQRAALTISDDDNGAWLLTTDTDLFWQVAAGAWVQRDVTPAPLSVVTKTGAYTLTNADDVVLVDATSGAVTITLHAAASAKKKVYYFKKVDASANAMTLDGNGAETIDGAATQSTTTQYAGFSLVPTGSAWVIV